MSAISKAFTFTTGLFSGSAMMILLVVIGIYISYRIDFIHIRHFIHIARHTTAGFFIKPDKKKGTLSPFQALTTALAGTIGTGNIAGVAGALTLGGPGAIFWMWVAAVIGMGTKYAEIVLAVFYRQKNIKGEWVGGPMYYIKNGLSEKYHPLALLFCLFGCIAALGTGNMTQANTVAVSFMAALPQLDSTLIRLICGIIIIIILLFVLLGGTGRIGQISEKMVPLMAVLYILSTAIIIIANIEKVLPVTRLIFLSAFDPQAVFGAGAGVTITQVLRHGVSRGVFSNEAGLGSAPIAHGSASTDCPVKQGFLGIVEVAIDTIVICSLTAYTILVSDITIPYGVDVGSQLTVSAFAQFYGDIAPKVLAIAISLFAISSMISWYLYGLRCFEMLFKGCYIFMYKLLFLAAVIPACLLNVSVIWNIAGLLNGLMTTPNIIALVMLCGRVAILTKDYFSKIKA